MCICRELVGTPPSLVGASLAQRPAKARLDPVGVSVLHSPTPAPRHEPTTFIYPKESWGALRRVEWEKGPHASGCNWKHPSSVPPAVRFPQPFSLQGIGQPKP